MSMRKWKYRKHSVLLGILMAISLAVYPSLLEWLNANPPILKWPIPSHQIPVHAQQFTTPTPTLIPETPLTVNQILEWSRNPNSNRLIDQLPQNEISQIILTGDVMLGRAVNFNMVRKNDYTYPFFKVAELLRKADISVVNLESPFAIGCPLTGEGMQLCTQGRSIESLQFAGIDIAQIANNHALDYGVTNLNHTKDWLKLNGIDSIGSGQASIKDVRGIKFGFLAYNQVGAENTHLDTANNEILADDLRLLSEETDIQIVGFHWGEEYQNFPNLDQRSLAKKAVQAGADIVYGHHPHWVQAIDVYQGKPIFYSLGNFIFDQMWSKETREGMALELTYWKSKLIKIRLLPIFMNDFAQPEWQVLGVGNTTLGKVERISEKLNQ